MTPEEARQRIPESEFTFFTSRSSGPGGQNVNKVSTKVEIRFNIHFSESISESEKMMIYEKLKNRINSSGELIVRSQSERSQQQNRKMAVNRMYNLISEALTEKPFRKPTLPTRKSRVERLNSKRIRGLIKKMRSEDKKSSGDF